MKSYSYDQYAIVHADTAPQFNELINEEMERLKGRYPVVTFSDTIPFYAQIRYKVKTDVPETVTEAAEIQGVRFTCEQCPCFVPVRTEAGEIDKRCKRGDCTFEGNELGRTLKDMAACDHLYELIQEGGVRICWAE